MKHILLIALLLFALLPSKADWNLVSTNNPNLLPANNPNHNPANNPDNLHHLPSAKQLTITPTVETVFYAVSNYNIANQYINHAPTTCLKK